MSNQKNLFVRLIILFMAILSPAIYAQPMPRIETGVSQTLAQWRAAHYSDVRYKLNLTLEKQSPVLKGSIEIRVVMSEPRAIASGSNVGQNPLAIARGSDVPIILDWRKIAGKEQFAAVSNAIVNDQPAKFAEENEHLIFKENVRTGENVIKLDFTSPIATSGAAVTRYVDKEDGAEYVYSLFVPSDVSTAFPCFDQPDLKARFELNIKAPQEWKVVSNTKASQIQDLPLTHSEDYKKNLYIRHFAETQPISTYVFAFAAGDFAEFEDGDNPINSRGSGTKKVARRETSGTARANDSRAESAPQLSRTSGATKSNADSSRRFTSGYLLDASLAQNAQSQNVSTKIYVRKSQAEKFKQHSAEVFRLNREGVRFLESYFDFKFPFPKYDLVLIPEFPFGGMEHAGCTFLRESSIIFPQEPTANDYISRGNLIFHEAAHQWFGDTVTMRWFDDLWLKEGFAEFMAYKTMEKVLPQYNAWKAFYERNKPLAYQTDSTRGTTAIYQPIANLSAAKSAYGNIVYRKAPSFLRQAEFFLGADKFQTAARAFLKQNAFKNAEWQDLVKSFQEASGKDSNTINLWAENWVKQRGLPIVRGGYFHQVSTGKTLGYGLSQKASVEPNIGENKQWWTLFFNLYIKFPNGKTEVKRQFLDFEGENIWLDDFKYKQKPVLVFPNYQDYGYGIFLLDEKSRDYILANIQNEKDDFLRAMMWGALWDSVREAELAPDIYVETAIKNIGSERDELTVATILNRVGTAMNYYIENNPATNERATSEPRAVASGLPANTKAEPQNARSKTVSAISVPRLSLGVSAAANPPLIARGSDLGARLEKVLLDRMANAETLGQRVTFYRAFLNLASTENGKQTLKDVLSSKFQVSGFKLKTKDKFDIVTRLLILNDADAPKLLDDLAKTETSDDAKRYLYAARAGIASQENKQKFFDDFLNNKEISESYIETAFVPFNSIRHSELTLPLLERALAELPNLKRTRKIFFVNGWLAAFVGGQKDERALNIVNKFLDANPNLDADLRLKVLENVDAVERAVRIKNKFHKQS